MARTPSERVPYPSPLAALDLSIDWSFVAFLQKLYVGDCLGPVNSENATQASVNEDLTKKVMEIMI